MPETYLRFIPVIPDFVPGFETIDPAVNLLKKGLPQAGNVEFRLTGHIEFINSGSLFERIHCPFCRHEIYIETWDEWMGRALAEHFQALIIQTPCCKKEASLNDLIYDQPQGFARFVLETRVPEVFDLPDGLLPGLEKTLNTSLRPIWAMYE
jgi:hypothetical protein